LIVATVDDDCDDIEKHLEGIPRHLAGGRNALSIVEGVLELRQLEPLGH
jgi:hypothetical protein